MFFSSLKYLYLLSLIIEYSQYIMQLILKFITLLELFDWFSLVDCSNCLNVKMERLNLNCSLNIKNYFFQLEILIFSLFYQWALLLYNTTFTKLFYSPGFFLLNFFSWVLELFIYKNGKNKFKLFSKYLIFLFFFFSSLKYLYLLCFIIEHSHYGIQLTLKYIYLFIFPWIYFIELIFLSTRIVYI